MFLAWKEFKKGKKKKQDVREFEFNLEDNLFQLHQELKDKIYCHAPYSAFYVTDPKLRNIHKACVRDRVLHHAIFRILYPILDEQFIFDSYSCRLNKGSHRAVRRLKSFCCKISGNNSANITAVKCDVKKFFDSVDHSILLQLIQKRICDEDALWLIELVIKSFRAEKGVGLPIGNVTSQLFANIYLNELDRFAKHTLKIKYYLRYCDDFVLLSKNREELVQAVNKVSSFLWKCLKLSLHPNKIIFRKYHQGVDFLGYIVRPYCVNLRTKTRRRILQRVNKRNHASYWGVLKHCNGYKIKKIMDAKLEKNSFI
ncbi:MAG: reverse transcriptase/maturase family protein [bacterium]|nr:reverse transcriptase/maturase family protein [bacterium]